MPREVFSATVGKATAGAFIASFIEPWIQGVVARQEWAAENEWIPVITNVIVGIVILLPQVGGWRPLQLTAGAVFFANALSRAIGIVAQPRQ